MVRRGLGYRGSQAVNGDLSKFGIPRRKSYQPCCFIGLVERTIIALISNDGLTDEKRSGV